MWFDTELRNISYMDITMSLYTWYTNINYYKWSGPT